MAETTEPKDRVRVIQFQMVTDTVTGGSFQITTDVPQSCSVQELAAEIAVLREAGFWEMAASNKRRLEHNQIERREIEAKVFAKRQAGKQIKNTQVDEARQRLNMEEADLEAKIVADETMLLRNAPELTAAAELGS